MLSFLKLKGQGFGFECHGRTLCPRPEGCESSGPSGVGGVGLVAGEI